MPLTPTYPGVYIEELPGNVHTISGVSTSNTAFIDVFPRGPVDTAVRISSSTDFERVFGGLDPRSEAGYQLPQFYLNGGQTAFVVRIALPNATLAGTYLPQQLGQPTPSRFRVEASSPGVWGNRLQVAALVSRESTPTRPLFSLQCREVDANGDVLRVEDLTGLTSDPNDPQYAVSTVNRLSQMIRLVDVGNADPAPFLQTGPQIVFQTLTGGADGDFPENQLADALIAQVTDDSAALSRIAPDLFNILCIPATSNMTDPAAGKVLAAAQKYCQDRRAFLIIDIPPSGRVGSPSQMLQWFQSNLTSLSLPSACAAVYYPRLRIADPLNSHELREFGVSGTIAGIFATTDVNRGVWKAPAGAQAVVSGAVPAYIMTDADNGILNPLGINTIRSFPVYGVLVWGARTVQGADELAGDWKYIPVRRLALYLESSLYQGLAWAVFEPNETALWRDIVLSVTSFMNDLFRQGAFQGSSPEDAFFVKCDESTTTQVDIDRGIVNIVVGFAPLIPAEFVIIRISQLAGQSPTT